MSRKDTILKAAKRTAKEAREAAASRRGRGRSNAGVDPHRHCVVCWTPVPLEEEPAVCGKEECSEIHMKRERSRKRLVALMYLIPAITVIFVIQGVMGASG
ncbi:MAG TPA: DUF2116 family Zn-ribbon domain-containing protein [Candidatus Thalassarchaeaceae archaeon]|jgi:predicted nucleic acid-binding Zn ribbon protein|nr:DUF2116 family Zn-ribbon domain-containing protein [Candidatus Thalassarchaeaceae archaeon]|tara:strand:- start:2930 stop:3232 length:303 start_codon:yes stop_codon:yes gene_type:complete